MIISHSIFPANEEEEQFFKVFKEIFTFLIHNKGIEEDTEQSRSEHLANVYGCIMYRYPLTTYSLLPQILTHNLHQHNYKYESINQWLYELALLNIIQADVNNVIIEPGKEPEKCKDYIINILKKENIGQDLMTNVIYVMTRWVNHVSIVKKDRNINYLQVFASTSDKEAKETFSEDMHNLDGYSEINLISFSTENLPQKSLEISIENAAKLGVKYKILLLDPKLGKELEGLKKVKKEIKEGIKRIKNLKKKYSKDLELRVIKPKQKNYANFYGLLKVADRNYNPPFDRRGPQDVYRCFLKNPYERGVMAILIRGEYNDLTLFQILKNYFDLVWKKSYSYGFLGWLNSRRIGIYLLGLILISSILMIIYTITLDIKSLISSTILSGIFLPASLAFLTRFKNRK